MEENQENDADAASEVEKQKSCSEILLENGDVSEKLLCSGFKRLQHAGAAVGVQCNTRRDGVCFRGQARCREVKM